MCGIAGLFKTAGNVEETVLHTMTEAVRHRGPDDFGFKMFPAGGIGNRRLSVIDLKTGKQPLTNEDQTIWITFNGEIYNYKELTKELKKNGHFFKTNTDTETIIHAYEQWGTSSFKKLKGMFAFALVDLNLKRVILVRDHFGIKPLFYLKTENLFAFGSELQQFKSIPGLQLSIDFVAIDQYLWLKYIPAPRTIFKEIVKLPPAHYMIYALSGKLGKPQEYWRLSYAKKESKTEAQWLEELDHQLRRSVQEHLTSDVDLGIFLSGGIDSSLVTSYAVESRKEPVKTFSIGFSEEKYDERKYAQIAWSRFNTDHYVEVIKPESLLVLPELVKHYGEPFGDSSCIAVYFLCRLAREHVKVALCGEGGDECFAGYLKYGRWLRHRDKRKADGTPKGFHFLKWWNGDRDDTLTQWLLLRETVNADRRKQLWTEDYRFALQNSIGEFDGIADQIKTYSPINRLQYIDFKTYLLNQLLVKMDIASMLHGLEVRTPLTDKDVWEFAASMPEQLLYRRDTRGAFEGKILLKKLALRHFEDSFVYRRKHGFPIPLEIWLAEGSPSRDWLENALFSPSARILDFFRSQTVREMLQTGCYSEIWQILVLEEWLRNFFDASSMCRND